MSYIGEKVSYLQGLAEGMNISNADSNEAKLLLKIIEVLEEISDAIDMQDDIMQELAEYIDDVDEDLALVEEFLIEEDEYEDEEDDDDDFWDDFDEDEFLEIVCPSCDDVIYYDVASLIDGELDCPSCGKEIVPKATEEE